MEQNSNEIKDLSMVEDPESGVVENTPVRSEGTEVQPKKRGRPPGAKNKDTLFKELMAGKFQDIAQINIEKTFEVLFEEAHDGNMAAIKMIMDRVVPATKAVDLDDLERKGLTIQISVGNLEDSVQGGVPTAEVIEDAEYEEITDGND